MRDVSCVYRVAVKHSCQRNEEYAARYICLTTKVVITVFDPEIPVNVYDLGLIYKIEVENGVAHIDMTLTAPNCPAADFIIDDIRMKVESIEGIERADVQLVFEPEWSQDMMSEEAKLDLGFL